MNKLRILGIVCLIALFTASTVSAKELPTKENLTNFIDTIPKDSNFADAAFNKSVTENPTWPVDKWSDGSISFYHKALNLHGYESIYFNDSGVVLESVNDSITPVDQHTGDEEVNNVMESENNSSDCEEVNATEEENVGVSSSFEAVEEMTSEQIKSEIMDYFTGKEEVTISGIQDLLDKCLPDGYVLVKEESV